MAVCESMTPRERWLSVLYRRKPDRFPMDYSATDEATQKLVNYLGCVNHWEMYEYLHIDPLLYVEPDYIGPSLPPNHDIYDCEFIDFDYGGGVYSECIGHPLAAYNSIEEIEENYKWPCVDWFYYTTLSDKVKGLENFPLCGGGSEPFWTYRNLRGEEQAYMDLIINPELVHYCLTKLYNFRYENARRIYEQIPARIDITIVAEDLGSQEGLLISPDLVREFFLPDMRRMIELAHNAGACVFFHSDGAIRDILPDLVEIGIDILDPIQWRCKNMDRETLMRDFGEQVVFHGGVDNQYTLAFGTIEEVREEVRTNIQILGRNGGYILAPCHNIQVISPPEIIAAMYETGYEFGKVMINE